MGMDVYVYEIRGDGEKTRTVWEEDRKEFEVFDEVGGKIVIDRSLDLDAMSEFYGVEVDWHASNEIDGHFAWDLDFGGERKTVLERWIPTKRIFGRELRVNEIDYVRIGSGYTCKGKKLLEVPTASKNVGIFRELLEFLTDERKEIVKEMIEKYDGDERKLLFNFSW